MKKFGLALLLGTLLIMSLPTSAAASDITACFEAACTCGGACSFDASCSTGTITKYAWTYDDGLVGVGEVSYHTYSEPGQYQVTLVASRGSLGEGTFVYDLVQKVITVGCN